MKGYLLGLLFILGMQSVFAQNSYNLSFRNKTTKLGQTGYCGTLLQVQSNLLMINNAGGNGRVEVRENNAFGTLLGAITFTKSQWYSGWSEMYLDINLAGLIKEEGIYNIKILMDAEINNIPIVIASKTYSEDILFEIDRMSAGSLYFKAGFTPQDEFKLKSYPIVTGMEFWASYQNPTSTGNWANSLPNYSQVTIDWKAGMPLTEIKNLDYDALASKYKVSGLTHAYPAVKARYQLGATLNSLCFKDYDVFINPINPPAFVTIIDDLPNLTLNAYHAVSTGNATTVPNPVLCGTKLDLEFKNNTPRDYIFRDDKIGIKIGEFENWTIEKLNASGNPTGTTITLQGNNNNYTTSTGIGARRRATFNKGAGTYRITLHYGTLLESKKTTLYVLVLDASINPTVSYSANFVPTGSLSAGALCLNGDIDIQGTFPAVFNLPAPATGTYPFSHTWELKEVGGATTQKDNSSLSYKLNNLFGNLTQGKTYNLKLIISINKAMGAADAGCFFDSNIGEIVLPIADFKTDWDCEILGTPKTRALTATETTPPSYVYTWRLDNGGYGARPNKLPVTIGNHALDLKAEATSKTALVCSFIKKNALTVQDNPKLTFANAPSVCDGTDASLTVNNCANCENINQYTWVRDKPASTATTTTNQYTFLASTNNMANVGASYNVSVSGTYMNGKCSFDLLNPNLPNPETIAVGLKPRPVMDFSFDDVCKFVGDEVEYKVTSNTNEPSKQYDWLFDNNPSWNPADMVVVSNAPVPNNTVKYAFKLINSSSRKVTLRATGVNGCQSSIDKQILMQEILRPNIFMTSSAPIDGFCSGQTVAFETKNLTGTGNTHEFWLVNPITTQQQMLAQQNSAVFNYTTANPTNELQVLSFYDIVSNSKGCTFKSDITTIVVNPEPKVNLINQVGCHAYEYVLNKFNSSLEPQVSYTWTYGTVAGNYNQNITTTDKHIFENTGNAPKDYFVRVQSTLKGCTATNTAKITVNPKPKAGFNLNPGTTVQPGVALTATSNALSNAPLALVPSTQISWLLDNVSTGNGNTWAQTFANDPSGLGNHKLTQKVVNQYGCTHEFAQDFLVSNNTPIVAFTPSVLEGCGDLEVTFSNQTQNATLYEWNFGDGSKQTALDLSSVKHIFVNNTLNDVVYTVTLTARNENGIQATKPINIKVFGKPKAGFNVVNASTLRLDDANANSSKVDIDNTADLTANIVFNFGDGTVFSGANGANYPKIYYDYSRNLKDIEILQTVTNIQTCQAEARQKIWVKDYLPVAKFLPVNKEICNGAEAIFKDLFEHVETNTWDFGDGSVKPSYAAGQDIAHRYTFLNLTAPKEITVKVESVRINPDESPNHKKIANWSEKFIVNPNPNATFAFKKTTIYLATQAGKSDYAEINIQNLKDVVEVIIDFGDGKPAQTYTGAQIKNPFTYMYAESGQESKEYIVKVSLKDGKSCVNETTQNITVFDPPRVPVASFNFPSNLEKCIPVAIAVQNNTLYGKTYNWQIEMLAREVGEINKPLTESFSTTEASPAIVLSEAGKYRITLTAFNALGESHKISREIEVYPRAVSYFLPRDAYPRIVEPVEFINLSQNTDELRDGKFIWNFGDGSKWDETDYKQMNIKHRYKEANTYNITLQAQNKYACNSVYQMSLKVGRPSTSTDKTFLYPNVFRPSHPEGKISLGEDNAKDNTVFMPFSTVLPEEISSYSLKIYDKKGELIFISNQVYTGWDGTYKGKLLTQDVYVWAVEAVLTNNAKIQQAGDVLLLR